MKKQLIISTFLLSLTVFLCSTVKAVEVVVKQPTVTTSANPSFADRIKQWWHSFWDKSKELGHEAKEKTGHAWDETKEGVKEGWDKSKELGHEAKEKTGNAWDKTKEGVKEGWDKTKEVAEKGLEKIGLKQEPVYKPYKPVDTVVSTTTAQTNKTIAVK